MTGRWQGGQGKTSASVLHTRPVETTILPSKILDSAWLERINSNRLRCNASHSSKSSSRGHNRSVCWYRKTTINSHPRRYVYVGIFFAKRRVTALPNCFRFVWVTDVTHWYEKLGCYKVRDDACKRTKFTTNALGGYNWENIIHH